MEELKNKILELVKPAFWISRKEKNSIILSGRKDNTLYRKLKFMLKKEIEKGKLRIFCLGNRLCVEIFCYE